MTGIVVNAPTAIAISVRRSGGSLTAATTLTYPGVEWRGQAHRDDNRRERAIAQATLDALREVVSAALESAQVLSVPGRRVAVTVVEFPDALGEYRAYVGSALVHGEVEDALARSVLNAVTDWIDTEETP